MIDPATESFKRYLDETQFTVTQIRFVNLIVDELTKNGIMGPGRLFEPPYTDQAPTGPDLIFPEADVDRIVQTLRESARQPFLRRWHRSLQNSRHT